MDEVTTYGAIAPRIGMQAVAKLLAVGQPLMHLQRFAMQETAKKNAGDSIKWRRYLPFTVSKAPLTEGVPPSAIPLQKTDYTAILQQYGALSYITDKVADLHEDGVLAVHIKRHGELMAKTIELITWDVVTAGTNVYYASAVANRAAVVDPPSRGDFRLIGRGFDRNDATQISSIIKPTPMVSTRGIESAYIALAHTDLRPDLRGMTGYASYVEYGAAGKRMPGEDGSCEGFRFILSRLYTPLAAAGGSSATMLANGVAPGGSTSCDVYQIVCLAREAYGVVRLQTTGKQLNSGKAPAHVMVVQPDKVDSGNRLAQKGSIGWKVWYAAAILNEQWIARLECACTATPS